MDIEAILKKSPADLTPDEKLYLATIAAQAATIPEVRNKMIVTSIRPYYSEKHALQLAEQVIDPMIEDKVEREFPYDEFLENQGWSKDTLYNYVQQARDWLADNGDPKYRKFKDETKLTKRKNDTGVRFLWKKNLDNKNIFASARVSKPAEEQQEWRNPLYDWLSDPNPEDVPEKNKIKITDITLKDGDIDFIRQLVESPENAGRFIILRLTSHEIIIGRVRK